jgi:hypothetical protein
MKPSPSILIVVALFTFISSNATPKVATESAAMSARFTSAWHALPLPNAQLQIASAAIIFELRYRSAERRTASAVLPVIVRLIISRSGKAQISILSHNFRLAFPCRSA